MWPFRYPYTNFHELNLDWILSEIKRLNSLSKELTAKVDNVDNEIKNDVRDYINSDEFDAILNDKISQAQYIINVKDYGALGDGETDDTAAFQAALNAAAKLDGPGVVFIPFGIYNCNSITFGYHRGVTILGERSEFDSRRCSTIRYIGTGYCITLSPTDYAYMYGCRICNINIIFRNACAGGFNIKNLEESVFDNVSVLAYDNNNVVSAFNINGLTISTLRNIRTNGARYAFNLVDTSTGENPRGFGGSVNICECNFFQHNAVFNVGKGIDGAKIYNNWAESFNSFVKVQNGQSTAVSIKIYDNTFFNNDENYRSTVLDMTNSAYSEYDIEIVDNIILNSHNASTPFKTDGETFIQGRIAFNKIKGYSEPIFNDQQRLFNVAIYGNRKGTASQIVCNENIVPVDSSGNLLSSNGITSVTSKTMFLGANANTVYSFIIVGNEWTGKVMMNGRVLVDITNPSGCIGGEIMVDKNKHITAKIGGNTVEMDSEARITLYIENGTNNPVIVAIR